MSNFEVRMKTILLSICLVLNVWVLQAQDTIVRKAEDLWGNPVAFDSIIRSTKNTIIQPFSSANCGYCLVDGYFASKNYLEANREKGGLSFTQCLFNPQLDVYAFDLHYRDSLTPTLTYPPLLHQYHQDGYPSILAFRGGMQIVKIPEGYLSPYDSMFYALRMTLWNDSGARFKPTGDLHFASRLIYENEHYKAVCVIPDGDTARQKRELEFASRVKCYTVKFLGEVTTADLSLHVYLQGTFRNGFRGLLSGIKTPFRIIGDSVLIIGNYRFGLDTIAFSACLPNPVNPEKYMMLNIRGPKCLKGFYDNSVDFSISSCTSSSAGSRLLLQGFFDKTDAHHWVYSDPRTISYTGSPECKGICRIPASKFLPGHSVVIEKPYKKSFEYGTEYTHGGAGCRFPSIARDAEGMLWVAWEEKGDILLSSLEGKKPLSMAVECDRSRSYDPLVAVCNKKVWVFWLNDRDGFYRLYGRNWDGKRLTDPVIISEVLPCDAVTPSVVCGRDNSMVLAWTYWKANFRFPFYRIIRDGVPDSVHPLEVVRSSRLRDYTNAWWISLSVDANGKFWGAWNQHYPATLGVCAGDLAGSPSAVTAVKENIDDCENGGYPFALTCKSGRRMVFRETIGWDVLETGNQKILVSGFDTLTHSWSLPSELTTVGTPGFNQTPSAAEDENGRTWVVWSGRNPHENSNWSLYLASGTGNTWSEPLKITSGEEAARAPHILAGQHGELWICCHYGTGESMRVKIFRVNTSRLGKHHP
jgi:hypothetical protein